VTRSLENQRTSSGDDPVKKRPIKLVSFFSSAVQGEIPSVIEPTHVSGYRILFNCERIIIFDLTLIGSW